MENSLLCEGKAVSLIRMLRTPLSQQTHLEPFADVVTSVDKPQVLDTMLAQLFHLGQGMNVVAYPQTDSYGSP